MHAIVPQHCWLGNRDGIWLVQIPAPKIPNSTQPNLHYLCKKWLVEQNLKAAVDGYYSAALELSLSRVL